MSTAQTRVGFSYAKGLMGLFSRLIMTVSKSRASHAWLLYYDLDFECDMVMEAHTTWRLLPFDEFKRNNVIVAVFVPHKPIDSGLRYGGSLLGSGYDVAGLLGMFFVELGKRLRQKIRNPFRSKRSVFCTEGVARVMNVAEYPRVPSPDDTDIEDLIRLLETDGSRKWQTE